MGRTVYYDDSLYHGFFISNNKIGNPYHYNGRFTSPGGFGVAPKVKVSRAERDLFSEKMIVANQAHKLKGDMSKVSAESKRKVSNFFTRGFKKAEDKVAGSQSKYRANLLKKGEAVKGNGFTMKDTPNPKYLPVAYKNTAVSTELKPNIAPKPNEVINVDVSGKKMKNDKAPGPSNPKVMSGRKKALIALAVIGGAAAIAGGVYAYKQNKEYKQWKESKLRSNKKLTEQDLTKQKWKEEKKRLKIQKKFNNYSFNHSAINIKQEANKMNSEHSVVFIEREGSNSLTHFGIKGQKWGIRRFQNEDGSLTDKGKSQYVKESKISGGNKGAVAGMAVGGAVAGARIAKSYLKIQQRGKNAGKIVSSGKSFSPVSDGFKLMGLLALGGFLGKKIGEKIGKKKGKEDIAEYGKQYITQNAGLTMKSSKPAQAKPKPKTTTSKKTTTTTTTTKKVTTTTKPKPKKKTSGKK